MSWDRPLFYAINRWPNEWNDFFYFISEATKQPVMRVVLLGVALGLIAYRPTRKGTLVGVLCWPLANALTDVLKATFRDPRPCVELTDTILRVNMLTSFGTASAHSANMAAVATGIWLGSGWKWGLPWAILAFLTGLSRIYVGAHYPRQVLLGWACGIFVAWVFYETARAFLRWRKKLKVEAAA